MSDKDKAQRNLSAITRAQAGGHTDHSCECGREHVYGTSLCPECDKDELKWCKGCGQPLQRRDTKLRCVTEGCRKYGRVA